LCAVSREDVVEALAAESAGQPLSRVRDFIPGADTVSFVEGKVDGRASASEPGKRIKNGSPLYCTVWMLITLRNTFLARRDRDDLLLKLLELYYTAVAQNRRAFPEVTRQLARNEQLASTKE
jgi:hypothetical protein